jgi:putative transposase
MISFKGRHFPKDIILMAVRWKLAYALSYRDIEELMAERGVKLGSSTAQKWTVHFAPQIEAEFRKMKRKVGTSWRMDETYLKVNGKWTYLYRAVDKAGKTVDFMLSEKRYSKSVLKFFKKAFDSNGMPDKVSIDKSGSNTTALKRINDIIFLLGYWHLFIEIRRSKYLNNIIEQDHRGIKRVTKNTTGFKSFESAQATIAGIELHRMLKKWQLDSTKNQPAWKQFYDLAV